MHRSKLRNSFLPNRFDKNRKKYSKQRNYYVCLLRRIKKTTTAILMRKTLLIIMSWKTVTPFLLDKVLLTERKTLIENDKIINDDGEAANTMNNFFSKIVINLNVPEYHDYEGISEIFLI